MLPRVDDLIGRELGGYRLIRALGRGATGAVYLGERGAGERTEVALKVLTLPVDLSPEEVAGFRARFRREVQTLLDLNHPHILSILGFGDDADTGLSYLVLPHLSETLAQRMARAGGMLSLPEAATCITQLADALDYAHLHGVIHRDVKPANVLLDKEGNFVLADFSIAYLFDRARTALTATGRLVGTPNYMSPEQVKGEHVGPAADIYGLGVLAYQLTTGRVPFDSTSLFELIQRITTEPPMPPSRIRADLPEPGSAAILHALAKRPEHRFRTALALAHAFSSGTQGQWAKELLAFQTADATVYDQTEASAPASMARPSQWRTGKPPREYDRPHLFGSSVRTMLLLSALGITAIALVIAGVLAFASLAPLLATWGSTQVPLVSELLQGSAPTQTPFPTATDIPTPTDTPIPTPVLNYSAAVPGPRCGSSDWAVGTGLGSRVQCGSSGLLMTSPADAATLTAVYWNGAGSPTSYSARVTVSGLSRACAGIGFQSGYRGYVGYVCSDGVWEVLQYDSTGAPSQRDTGSVSLSDPQLIEMVVTSGSFTFRVGAATVYSGSIAAGYDPSTPTLALMDRYAGQAGQGYFSDFVYALN